jgi:spermidine/putrescine ABC transporter ATP-binding subunit
MAEPALRLIGLEKRFGSQRAVAGVDLEVKPGEFVTLLGPSGCGKTTTLNMIAGFLEPSAGSIEVAGKAVERLPPFRRNLGVVFQDYALFPHMTVAENVGYGLRMRGVERGEAGRRVDEALGMVKLSGLGGRRPNQLSGGQRQRVALARALVIRPSMLLLDEPLSNLDLKLREEMRSEITGLQRQLGIAAVFVTHDQGEALAMSDRVAVMQGGRIEQCGTPAEIYQRPRSRFVAEFIGSSNLIEARRIDAGPGRVRLQAAFGELLATADAPVPEQALVVVRPERLSLHASRPEGDTVLAATVTGLVYLGARTEVTLGAGGQRLLADVANDSDEAGFIVGGQVFVRLKAEDCRVLQSP